MCRRVCKLETQEPCALQVFSATFNGQNTTQGNATTGTPPSLQIEAVAPTSNLEVVAVNLSSLNTGGIEAFSGDFNTNATQTPEQAQLTQFCAQLLSQNPGEYCSCFLLLCAFAAVAWPTNL